MPGYWRKGSGVLQKAPSDRVHDKLWQTRWNTGCQAKLDHCCRMTVRDISWDVFRAASGGEDLSAS